MATLVGVVQWVIVAEEFHADGSPHLHLAVMLSQKIRTSSTKFADLVTAKMDTPLTPDTEWYKEFYHGNYQAMHHVRKAAIYCQKTGNRSCTSFGVSIEVLLQKQGSGAARAADMVLNGATVDDVAGELPGFTLLNLQKVQAFVSFIRAKRSRVECALVSQLRSEPTASVAVQRVQGWLQSNLVKDQPRAHKKKQLWIYSQGPNVGKTTMLETISKKMNVYRIPDEDWYNDFEDGLFNLSVLDEYCGGKTIRFLNMWAEGCTMPLKRKGTTQYIKKENIALIVCANQTPEETYPNSERRWPLILSRFLVIEIKEGDFIKLTWA